MSRLNREEALKRLDGERELYDHMAGYFIRDYGDYPERVRRFILAEDREAYVITHSLKNLAASLGAEELASRALELELLLKAGQYGQTEAALGRVSEEFRPVWDEVERAGQGKDRKNSGGDGVSPWPDFPSLLEGMAEAFGSFSPEEVGKALSRMEQSASLVPESFREDLVRVSKMAEDYRFFEGEELILELQKRVLE